jgi:adenylosuccinate lyase
VIERYTRPELGAVWTDEARMTAWRDVEVAAAEGLQGGPTPEELELIAPPPSPSRRSRSASASRTTDVAAFVECCPADAGAADGGSTTG